MAPDEKMTEEAAPDAEMKEPEPADAEPAAAEPAAAEPAAAETAEGEAAEAEAAPAAEGEAAEAEAPRREDGDEADGAKDEQKGDDKYEPEDMVEEAPEPEPEVAKELEEDAPADGRPAVEGTVTVSSTDTTLNVAASCGGKVLMALSDGGFQYMLAGARANTGMKAGRYFYEVRIVETRNPLDPTTKHMGQRAPRQMCCIGFSAAGSSLFLGDGEEGVGFDSEGNFLSGKGRNRITSKFVPYSQVFGVLLNLDQASPNANTISLFCNGVRAGKPQPIPECLKGKVVYPTVNYKNMTLHVNFGPGVMAPLPFRCLTLQEAAAEDVVMSAPKTSSDRCEVIFPVGLPDEGTFDWLDDFLKRNPDYVELSSRAILDWGLKSGVFRQRGSSRSCNDRPVMEFGVRELDDDTIRQMIMSVAPVLKRNYVVMEVQDNLLASGRRQLLKSFDSSDFKRTALVVVGEPPEEHKARVRQLTLQEKRQRAAAEARRKRGMGGDERGRRVPPPPKAGSGEAEEEEKEEPEESLEEAVKKAEEATELTEDEKALWFRKSAVQDLTKKDLSQQFGRFTLPTEDDGFDEIKYEWQNAEGCAEYMKVWVSERKLTQRVEDLQPGQWFRDQFSEWNRLLQDWRRKHTDWRDPHKRKWQAEKRRREEKEEKKEKEEKEEREDKEDKEDKEEKDQPALEQKEDSDEKMKDSEEGQEEKEAGENGEAKEAKPEEPKAESKMEDVKVEDMDVFSVDDICDAADGEPLFANFTWEDWMLLSLRFEFHLLVHAYCRDINDPERTSFHEQHLAFYYNKYFKKQFTLRNYGVNTELELLELIKDTIEVAPKNSILDAQLSEDTPMDNFVRLTEDHRRERQRRIDAGDETAVLKFQKPPPRQQHGGPQTSRGGYQRGPPPPVPSSRGGPPGSRQGPAGGGPQGRYGAPPGGARAGGGAYSGGGSGRGGAPHGGRYGTPAPTPPPSRGYGGAPQSSAYGGGGQKRSYQPPSGGGGSYQPPYKQARGSGPPSSRGSGYGGGSSGYSGGGYGGSGGYRR